LQALHYKGCKFHRIVNGTCCQAGDFELGSGSGGECIWGGEFQDEAGGLAKRHVAGALSMANKGISHTNTSQFFICTAEAPGEMDGRHVVFGQVSKGMEVVRILEEVEVDDDGNDAPRTECLIADCGLLPKP